MKGGGVRRHVPPRSQAELPTGLAIDQFTQDVGVPGVSRRFLEQVHQDPAEVRRRPVADVSTQVVEAPMVPHDGIDAPPAFPVCGHGSLHRVVGRDAVVRSISGETGKAPENPQGLRPCHVLHQPQERGPATDGGSPGSVLIDSLDLPNQGLALVLQECLHGGELILVESRRLPIRHR